MPSTIVDNIETLQGAFDDYWRCDEGRRLSHDEWRALGQLLIHLTQPPVVATEEAAANA